MSRRWLIFCRTCYITSIICTHEIWWKHTLWRRNVSLFDSQLFLVLLDSLNLSHNSKSFHIFGKIQIRRWVSRLWRRPLNFKLILSRWLNGGLAHLLLWVYHIFNEIRCESWPIRGFGRSFFRCLFDWRFLRDYMKYGLIRWRRRWLAEF